MRRVGRIELPPDRLPLMNHAQWCEYLRGRGMLSPHHRGCVAADRCLAHQRPASGDPWRYRRADVSR